MRILIAVLALLSTLAFAAPAWAGYDEGLAAFDRTPTRQPQAG